MTLSEIYVALNNGDLKTVTVEVKKFNKAYRDGGPLITDPEYDRLLETIKLVDPENEIFTSGVIETVDEVDSDRKATLQYPMYSLDKESCLEDIHKWLINKGLPLSTILICTAKYDGISILKDEYNTLAWSRGDGVVGETISEHYKMLNDNSQKIDIFTIGEMLIPKPVFASRTFYRENGEAFKNARNMIAGLKNSDTISKDLKYAKHVRYGFANEGFKLNKSEQLDFISKYLIPIQYKKYRADELNIDDLNELFIEWGKEYDIDGLVFDIDDKNIRKSLGRERNNNPAYSRAYKNPEWFQAVKTTILDIEWNISKTGKLCPVAKISPTQLDGVLISRVTLNNAKYVKANNLGVNSIISIKRSGGVIPCVVDVFYASGFQLPIISGHEVKWNENGVELVVEGSEEQKIKEIVSFFKILGTENVSEGIVNQLYENDYTTIKSILEMSITDFEKLNKFGKRKADIIYTNIKKSITDVNLSKLMHASNMFEMLGSKKLNLVCHYETKPNITDVMKIEGFSLISANIFIDGYDNFYNWLKTVPQITIETKKEKNMETNGARSLDGTVWCFTGVRLKPGSKEEKKFNDLGGTTSSTVTKNTTHLVSKDASILSSKMKSAKDKGVKIMSIDEFYEILEKL